MALPSYVFQQALLVFSGALAPPNLHSFPTRRSSDLIAEAPMRADDSRLARGQGLAFRKRGDERVIRGADHRRLVPGRPRSEEHTSELQSHSDLVCRLLLEKKNCMPASARR